MVSVKFPSGSNKWVCMGPLEVMFLCIFKGEDLVSDSVALCVPTNVDDFSSLFLEGD